MMKRWIAGGIALCLVAVGVLAAGPALAHDDQHGPGWHGKSRADELARRFLQDSQPAEQLAAASGTSCSGGKAGDYPCSNVDLLSFLPLNDIGGGKGNDVWGWTDPQTGGEYALMGRSTGTSFVDISDPLNPVYLGNLPTTRFSSSWRDSKVYRNHAFIVSEAMNHGMQVFDLTQLRNVSNPPVTFSATARYTGISTAHNIVINEQSGFAYIVGSNNCSGGLHMVDITNPTKPVQAGCFSGDGYTHDAQCVIYSGPDTEHRGKEICLAANEDTLTIVDVTNKSAPTQLSRTGYAGSEYTHQGWLTEDQRYFLLDDELDEDRHGHNTHTYIWDLVDLDNPGAPKTFVGNTPAIDHNQYVKGSHSFQADYRAGLRILDITDVANGNLSEVGYFDIYPTDDASEFNGAWSTYPYFASGVVVVSGIEQGLYVLRPNLGGGGGTNPEPVASFSESCTELSCNFDGSASSDDSGIAAHAWDFGDGSTSSGATVSHTYTEPGSYTVTLTVTANDGGTDSEFRTVTVQQAATSVHVGDLDASKRLRGKAKWDVSITVTVHDNHESPVGGATVTAEWSGAHTGTVSGTTASDGTIRFSTGTLSSGTSVTLTVTGVAYSLTYQQTDNHDPEADSDGTTIVVNR